MKSSHINSDNINSIFGTNIKKMSFSGVEIDSRLVKKNYIFFALKGKKTDGHNYIDKAVQNGASLVVVDKIQRNIKIPQIQVRSVHRAMIKLAKNYRKDLEGQIIAITGSIGKTGTKDALKKIIPRGYGIFCSRKSYNNNIGLPLEILNMSKHNRYGIFEMGMNHTNEISKLTKILQPDIACILNVSYVHGGNFKSIRKIALAKSEILNSSKNLKMVILNRDDKYFNLMKKESNKNYSKPILSFGNKSRSDIQLRNIRREKDNLQLIVSIRNKKVITFKLPYTHEHLVSNSLAIISCLVSLNLKPSYIRNFRKIDLTSGRGNLLDFKLRNKNIKIVDHSYNASPESYKATLKSFNNLKYRNKIYIIGEMFELGKKSQYYHKSLFRLVMSQHSDNCFFIGNQFMLIKEIKDNKKVRVFRDVNELINEFNYELCLNSIIYIKGSNAVGLSKFISHIKNNIK